MILTGLLIAAGAIAAVGVLSIFWDDLRKWLIASIKFLAKKIYGAIHGVKVFIEKMYRAYKQVSKTYYQDEKEKWYETTQTREIPNSEVPPEIIQKVNNSKEKKYDITNEFQKELELVH